MALAVVPAHAQQAPSLTSGDLRPGTNLDGVWTYSVDPYRDGVAGFHDPATERKFSEEFQADYYRQTLAMAGKIPNLVGMSPWILKDFRSPRRQHPIYQMGWNRKGLISETGQRKQAFDVLAKWYSERAAVRP